MGLVRNVGATAGLSLAWRKQPILARFRLTGGGSRKWAWAFACQILNLTR